MSTNLQKELPSSKDQLIMQRLLNGVNVTTSCAGGKLTLYNSNGGQLYSDIVSANPIFISDAFIKLSSGIYLIHYQTEGKCYSSKFF